METIFAITDYNGHFGSKWLSVPYRSGYNKTKLSSNFKSFGFKIEFIRPSEIQFSKAQWKGVRVLLTSSEERGLRYKSYLEDIAFGLTECGAVLLPALEYLQAHENKIKSLILQNLAIDDPIKVLKYQTFGTYEELEHLLTTQKLEFPCIVKKPDGSKGKGVYLAKNKAELKKITKKISRNFNLFAWLKENVRTYKHKGYKKTSIYSNKFLIQEFVPDLSCDWKVLIYGESIYILKRKVKSNDFRASGSGYGYQSGATSDFPMEFIEPLYQFFLNLKVPNLSIDFGHDGTNGFIFEFQALYYGTSTQYKSKELFKRANGEWKLEANESDQESIFTSSIVEFIERNK